MDNEIMDCTPFHKINSDEITRLYIQTALLLLQHGAKSMLVEQFNPSRFSFRCTSSRKCNFS